MGEPKNVEVETLKKLDLLNEKMSELIKIQRKSIMGYEYVNIVELSDIIGETVKTIYSRVHKRQIPYYKPGGKHLVFKLDEIKEWVESGRYATVEELRKRI